ncbi:hypothetical protein PanWU01x14_102220 [Parasponia andersonii]|uniref:Uncharacterized protein n=1 Tax=Parasponia andersonii TaxID=3476 RepID=A0A2P5D2X9_PARAD|nr:hypothetical protein PanWU01x14_102220 [Parasponia andersonii]
MSCSETITKNDFLLYPFGPLETTDHILMILPLAPLTCECRSCHSCVAKSDLYLAVTETEDTINLHLFPIIVCSILEEFGVTFEHLGANTNDQNTDLIELFSGMWLAKIDVLAAIANAGANGMVAEKGEDITQWKGVEIRAFEKAGEWCHARNYVVKQSTIVFDRTEMGDVGDSKFPIGGHGGNEKHEFGEGC